MLLSKDKNGLFIVRKMPGWGWLVIAILISACLFQALSENKPSVIKARITVYEPAIYKSPTYLAVPNPTPAEIRRLAKKIAEANPQLKSKKLRPGTQVFIPDGYFPQYYVVNEDDIGGYSDIATWRYQMRWNRILNEDGVDAVYLPQLTCSELK